MKLSLVLSLAATIISVAAAPAIPGLDPESIKKTLESPPAQDKRAPKGLDAATIEDIRKNLPPAPADKREAKDAKFAVPQDKRAPKGLDAETIEEIRKNLPPAPADKH